jgi:NADP-dependent 3-hydroxy acid dehydrogenase YdfG
MNKTIFNYRCSGIGKETAKLFQSKGWNVIATMRNPENETELKQLENVLVAKLDVLELDSIKKRLKMVFKNLEMLMLLTMLVTEHMDH